MTPLSRIRATTARGQAMVEIAVTVAFVIGGLIALALYMQRAYQGYLYAQASSQGQQFDPTQAYTDTRLLNSFVVVQESVTKVAGPGDLIAGGWCDDGNPNGNGCAPDLGGGKVSGRVIQSKSKSQSTWDIGRNANYVAN